MTNFIECYEGIASADYCRRMIAELDSLIETGSGNCLGKDANGGTDNRKDISRYFERDNPSLAEETNKILDAGLQKYLGKYPSLEMIPFYSQVVKVQKTEPKGGFHRWHSEQTNGRATNTRCLVWMIYLNNLPEGEGTTEFLEFGIKLQPKEGSLVLWPAAWTHTHRGNPVYTQNKYIATGWYYLN
jgi:hypothetical protein